MGCSFYDFPELENTKQQRAFKDLYRSTLDTLEVSGDAAHRIVGEANVAFRLNTEIFRVFDARANVPAHSPVSSSSSGGECPFAAPKKKSVAIAKVSPTHTISTPMTA